MSDIFSKVFGDSRNEQINKFDSGMKKIQEKHQQWFDSEINELGGIEFHYMTTFDSEKFHCFILSESNLPESIVLEVSELFNSIFKSQ